MEGASPAQVVVVSKVRIVVRLIAHVTVDDCVVAATTVQPGGGQQWHVGTCAAPCACIP